MSAFFDNLSLRDNINHISFHDRRKAVSNAKRKRLAELQVVYYDKKTYAMMNVVRGLQRESSAF